MRRIATTLALAGLAALSTPLVADTPQKGGASLFGSPKTPAPSTSEKLLLLQDKEKTQVQVEAKKANVDHSVKAASIEVAWLQDAVTYPLRLRADTKPGDDFITLTGYVPNDRLREKAVSIAKLNAGNIALHDQLMVYPSMALPEAIPTERDQAQVVAGLLEKAFPGMTQSLQFRVETNGVTTVSGRVDEFEDRRKIIRSLQGIPGCTAIRYDLRVMSPATVQTASATATVNAVGARVVLVSPATLSTTAAASASALSITTSSPAVTAEPGKSALALTAIQALAPVAVVSAPVAVAPARVVGSASSPSATARDAAFPILPPLTSFDKNEGGAPAFIDPAVKKPLVVPATKPVVVPVADAVPVRDLGASSLSGLFPPGTNCTATEPQYACAIQLGSPVVVRTAIPATVVPVHYTESVVAPRHVVTKPLVVSYTQDQPTARYPLMDTQPVLIPVMPREAK